MVGFLRFLEDLINYGDEYEKLPKVVPYLVLPVSMAASLVPLHSGRSADLARGNRPSGGEP